MPYSSPAVVAVANYPIGNYSIFPDNIAFYDLIATFIRSSLQQEKVYCRGTRNSR
jgi:hypothetical protein